MLTRRGPTATAPTGRRATTAGHTSVGLLQHLGTRAGNRAVSGLLTSVQRLGGDEAKAQAHRLLPASPLREVHHLALVLELFGRPAALRYVRWAPGRLADKEVAVEVGSYLTVLEARQHRLTWALQTAGTDAALLRGLLAVLADRPPLETVQWAWGQAAGDAEQTQVITDYDLVYRSQGPAVHGLARQALVAAGGDVVAAATEMTSLAAYNHDPKLRAWAAGQAAVLAADQVDQLKVAAETKRQTAVAAMGPDTPYPGAKTNVRKKANTEAKKKNDAERAKLEQDRDADLAAATAAEPALANAARQEMEGFLADGRTSRLDPADSAWLLQRVDGRAPLATVIRPLFAPAVDGRSATGWVLGRTSDPATAHRLVSGLLDARAAPLDEARAREVVGLAGWSALDRPSTQGLAGAIAKAPAVAEQAVTWLSGAPALSEAVALLLSWTRKAGQLADFVALANGTNPAELAWLVAHVGSTASPAAAEALQRVKANGTSVPDLTAVLKYVEPLDAERLLGRVNPTGSAVDARLFVLLHRASGARVVDWIVNRDYGVATLHGWIAGRALPVAELDPLIRWATEAQLSLLLSEGTEPAEVAAVLGEAPAYVHGLRTLAWTQTEVGKYHPSLTLLVGADSQKAHWDKGTFADPLHSVVYHYCKHVREESRAESVATYTADALALWAAHGPGFAWNSGRKIMRPTGRGGLYTNGGVPYSFWY